MISKKLLTTGALAALLFIISAFVQKNKTGKNSEINPAENKGFAVLELFTSEGCSSCPPADKLMGQIQQKWKNQPVYILSYHVDYWNRLGWRDKFSSAENSKRQQLYSYLLDSQAYTPQLIINGQKQFVGSDQDAIEDEITTALTLSNHVKIDLAAKILQQQADIDYNVDISDARHQLLITLIEKKSSSEVSAGENEGRYLQHWQIVRQQKQIPLQNSLKGTTTFQLPADFNIRDWEIVGFIQDKKSGKITGSTRAVFS